MDKKILLRLDEHSLTNQQISTINTNNTLITHLHDDLYVFKFDSIILNHVLLLLGTDESKYGFNLTNYLENTLNFLGHHKEEYLTLSFGSSDFKRKSAEDLGVAVASIFMANSFNLDWTSIVQMPRNATLSKKTPDFSGFSTTGEQFIYECKGTSTSQKVESQIKDALAQVKNYPIPDARKFAIASYFSSNKKVFYPVSFVFDPPFTGDFQLNENNSRTLHYLEIIKNIGLRQTYSDMRQVISKNLTQEKDLYYTFRTDRTIRLATDRAFENYGIEVQRLANLQYNGTSYIGQIWNLVLSSGEYVVFFGLDENIAKDLLRFNTPIKRSDRKNSVEKNETTQTSIFDDGTILQITKSTVLNEKNSP